MNVKKEVIRRVKEVLQQELNKVNSKLRTNQ